MSDLFADGFESGDLSAWDDPETGEGDLSAHSDAKLHGNYGLKCVIDDTGAIYVGNRTPDDETRYRCRFFLDYNSLVMANYDEFYLLTTYNNAWSSVFFIGLSYRATDNKWRIHIWTKEDDDNPVSTSAYEITDEPHRIEVDWKASSAPGENDGFFELIIDGVSKQILTGIDNDTKRVGNLEFGAMGLDVGTLGIFYLDDYASNNDGNEIGGVVHQATLLGTLITAGVLSKITGKIFKGTFIGTLTFPRGKWKGLGMGMFTPDTEEEMDIELDILKAGGFEYLRIDIPNWDNETWLALSKTGVLSAIAKGFNVVWGVSAYNQDSPDSTITTENWSAFRQAILDSAQWAQDNGVYEFQLSNEEEMHIWRHPISMIRASNVVTVTFTEDHGFTVPNPVTIWGAIPEDFNAYSANPVTITVTGAKTFTYPSVGDDGSVSNPSETFIGNMPEATIMSNIKALATDVQAIFTEGNVSYSSAGAYFMDKWHTLGRGNIDILAWNVYMVEDSWKDNVVNAVNWWGADHVYITEFNLDYTNLNNYSPDETGQAIAIGEMIAHFKNSGILRAHYFYWKGDEMGIRNEDGTYKEKIWEILLGKPRLTKKIAKAIAGNLILTGTLSAISYLLYRIVSITINAKKSIIDKLKLRKVK